MEVDEPAPPKPSQGPGPFQAHHAPEPGPLQQDVGAAADSVEEEEEEEEGDEGKPEVQWVQCERCQTWRVVPAELWPEVASRDIWYCQNATWDLTALEPFTPACKTRGRPKKNP